MKLFLPILLFASACSAENLRENVPTANQNEPRFLTGTGYGYDSQPASLQCDAIGQDCSDQICAAVSNSCATAGPRGPRGRNGARGPTGPAGRSGRDGADGKDGRDGARGPRGPAGPAGARGATGERGATGATGARGPAGATGPRGPTGARGPAGRDGAPGPQGPAGDTGPRGAIGRAGRDAPVLNAEVVCMQVSSDGESGGGSGGSSGGDGGANGGGSGGILLTPCQKGFATGATATCGAGYKLTGCVGYSTKERAAISATCTMKGNSCVCGGCLVGGHGNNIFLQAQASCCAVHKS